MMAARLRTQFLDAGDVSAINEAAGVIKNGGIVAFPTETVYGLGANALNPTAVARIYEAKERPYFDPLIVHVLEKSHTKPLVTKMPGVAAELISAFWPGPLTVVVPKSNAVPDIVTAGLPTVALRCPSHPVARALLSASECPIAAPSANRFGRLSPTTAQAVKEQLDGRVDVILDGGPTTVGVESTIILCTGRKPALLRAGGVPVEDIEKIVGKLAPAPKTALPQAPGSLPRHYAPRKPLILVDSIDDVPERKRKGAGALLYKGKNVHGFRKVENLTPDGDLVKAAAKLFSALARLEAADISAIYAEKVPEHGLGLAIMDRLRRAAIH